MWEDFQIGTRHDRYSAWVVDGYAGLGLSENDLEYWVHFNDLDMGGRICKSSLEGTRIAKMIAMKVSSERMDNMLRTIAVKRLTPAKISRLLRIARENGFRDGEQNIREKFAELMGTR